MSARLHKERERVRENDFSRLDCSRSPGSEVSSIFNKHIPCNLIGTCGDNMIEESLKPSYAVTFQSRPYGDCLERHMIRDWVGHNRRSSILLIPFLLLMFYGYDFVVGCSIPCVFQTELTILCTSFCFPPVPSPFPHKELYILWRGALSTKNQLAVAWDI